MSSQLFLKNAVNEGTCPHAAASNPGGLALITIGCALRSDDAVAGILAENLPADLTASLCHFDLGTFTNYLGKVVSKHQGAILVDLVDAGIKPGRSLIVDIGAKLHESAPSCLKSCHGLSLLDELKIAGKSMVLPERIFLFGVQVSSSDFGTELSTALKARLPELTAELALLISQELRELA